LKKSDLSLGEGNTPIIKSIRIPFYLRSDIELYFKNESYNPTGSYTDRGIYNIFERIIDRIPEGIIAYSSTGETGFSIAAYSSRAGLNSYIFVSKDEFVSENFSKIMLYDSKVVVVDASKENVIKMLESIGEQYPLEFLNPEIDDRFIKGEEKLVKEIVNKIGKVDYVFLGLEAKEENAYYFFKSIFEKNGMLIGGATTSKEFALQHDLIHLEAYEIEEAYNLLLRQEGILADKRSAIGLAGILKWDRLNGFEKGETVVQVIDKVEYKANQKFSGGFREIMHINLEYEKILDILKLKKIKV